jgi:alkylation response protein AidB-like acyl-CoA dehydrogenase
MREAVGNGMTITPVETMMNHSTTQVFFENVCVPVENMIGSMGDGLKCVLGLLNAERILIALY